jgi:hypothetical protein
MLDINAVNNVLKLQYTQPRVETLAIGAVLYSILTKKTDWVGGQHPISIRSALPGGSSVTFSDAQDNSTASVYKRFYAIRKHAYQLAILDGETQDSAESNAGAQLDAIKAEIDGTLESMIERIEADLCGNGGGALGRLTSSTDPDRPSIVSSNTVYLQYPADALKMSEGMPVQLSATDGTSGAVKASSDVLTSVDVDTGKLTVATTWDANITTAAALDYVFRKGDFPSVNSHPFGLFGWIPPTAPSATPFLGVDRSVDRTRLAGVRYTDGAGGPIDEILIRLATEVSKPARSRPDLAVLSPRKWAKLVQTIEARTSNVRYGKVQSTNGQFGYDSVQLIGPMGPIDVVAAPFYPDTHAHLLMKSTWYLKSNEGMPKILNRDGMRMQRLYNADADGVRAGYYGELCCFAPGWNGVALL